MNRREAVGLAAAGIAAAVLASAPCADTANHAFKSKITALAFDGFPIFDPRPVFTLAEDRFPGRGADLSSEWRIHQFEYTWLRVASQHYADFWQVTQEALMFAANKLQLNLTLETRKELMDAYLQLKTWPDVIPALTSLKKSGYRLAFLNNFTPRMLEANIRNAGLDGMFDYVLSTDRVKTFKPDPRAYQLGLEAMKLNRDEILFVAHAGWDASGAKLFGYPTYWVNRQNLPPEEFGPLPDGSGETLSQLVRFLT
ncbi:MAG: haloacid dehalogenase type II [Candidatus Acidiferrum sp.]